MQLIHKYEGTTKDMVQTNIATTENIIALKDKIQRESRRKVVEKLVVWLECLVHFLFLECILISKPLFLIHKGTAKVPITSR